MSKGSLADPGHQQSLGVQPMRCEFSVTPRQLIEYIIIQEPGVLVTGWKGFMANISCDVIDVKMVAKGKKSGQHVA